jgi:hypothetical protein
MPKRLGAALLVLLAGAGAGRAGEKDIAERLQKAGARIRCIQVDAEKDVLGVWFSPRRFTDHDLDGLCELRRLRVLDLNGTGLTDAGVQAVGGFPGLSYLDLGGTRVSDAGLKGLKGLRSLKTLSLHGTRVTDAGLAELAELEALEQLHLAGTGVGDAGLKTVGGLRRLRHLNLSGTRVTDAGLRELVGLAGLHELWLLDCPAVTDEGVAELRKALPDCKVLR